eukprot:scaffold253_cov72-Cylindrotheca_fusiformis.AAC.7
MDETVIMMFNDDMVDYMVETNPEKHRDACLPFLFSTRKFRGMWMKFPTVTEMYKNQTTTIQTEELLLTASSYKLSHSKQSTFRATCPFCVDSEHTGLANTLPKKTLPSSEKNS